MLRDQGDAAWAERNLYGDDLRPSLVRKAVERYEAAWAVFPDSPYVLERLAISCYYLANYYAKDAQEKMTVYDQGRQFGEKALLLNADIKAAVTAGTPIEKAVVDHAKLEDVPAIYWFTVNWARVVEDASLAKRAATAPKLKACMETVYRLAPKYYWGGVHRFFGAYFCKAPGQAHPAEDSQKEFDASISEGGENLENTVLKAEYYAVFVQDRKLYEQLLKSVIDAPVAKDPELLRLDNAEARKRAKKLLDEADDKF
jgi:hypothetical protein